MEVTVNELAKAAHTSPRALHYYDKIGLLKPAKHSQAGYRLYGADELLRLQQILYFKELGFSLEQVQQMLDNKMDIKEMLDEQETRLDEEMKRIKGLQKKLREAVKDKDILNPDNWQSLYDGIEPKEKKLTEWEEDHKQSFYLFRTYSMSTIPFLKPMSIMIIIGAIIGTIILISSIVLEPERTVYYLFILFIILLASGFALWSIKKYHMVDMYKNFDDIYDGMDRRVKEINTEKAVKKQIKRESKVNKK